METNATISKNDLYRFFVIVGLLMAIAGIGAYFWLSAQANLRHESDMAELATINLVQNPTRAQDMRKIQLEHQLSVWHMERKFEARMALSVAILGVGSLFYGFCNLGPRARSSIAEENAPAVVDSPAPPVDVGPKQEPEPVPTVQDLIGDPATSKWLLSALTSALQRDPVDAAMDAEVLQKVLIARMTAIFAESRRTQGTPTKQQAAEQIGPSLNQFRDN